MLSKFRIINEPSIWAGSHTPNLNGEKRFLRGGDYTSQRTMEADTFQGTNTIKSDIFYGLIKITLLISII